MIVYYILVRHTSHTHTRRTRGLRLYLLSEDFVKALEEYTVTLPFYTVHSGASRGLGGTFLSCLRWCLFLWEETEC